MRYGNKSRWSRQKRTQCQFERHKRSLRLSERQKCRRRCEGRNDGSRDRDRWGYREHPGPGLRSDRRVPGNGGAALRNDILRPARAPNKIPKTGGVAPGVAVRGADRRRQGRPRRIRALAADTTCCSVVALDGEGRALRPAIIWMDVRAEAEAAAVLATGDPALRVNCDGAGPVSAEWMIPKALWIARNEPEVFDRAKTICEYQDFINLRLTGRRCASLNNVSIRWHYSKQRGGPARTLVEKPRRVVAVGEMAIRRPGAGRGDRAADPRSRRAPWTVDRRSRRAGRRRRAHRHDWPRGPQARAAGADHRLVALDVRGLRRSGVGRRLVGHLRQRRLSRAAHH